MSSEKKTQKAPSVHTDKKTSLITTDRFREMLPDVDDWVAEIIKADLDPTKVIRMNSNADTLVDWAPNVLVWCNDKRFLGMPPYAKQCEILLDLYEEYCVRCSDLDYLRDIPVTDTFERVVSKIALLEFGVCPHCGFTKADGRTSGHFVDPTELVCPVGQRSGKCLDGDTEICADGERSILRDLVGKDFTIPTKDSENKITYAKATAFESGEKECLELVASHGGSVVLSTDHTVFTPDGWVESGDLSVGDLIAAPRRIPDPLHTLTISDDYIVSTAQNLCMDVCISSDRRVPSDFYSMSYMQICVFISSIMSHTWYESGDCVGTSYMSEGMIDDVQFLLLRLGVQSSKSHSVANIHGKSYDEWSLEVVGPDTVKLLEVTRTLQCEEDINSLANTEIRWQRVLELNPVGVRKVYDISVPETECFIASGMVLHNSAVTAFGSSYTMHRNLMLPMPCQEYGLLNGQVLDFTFVATRKDQSEKTLWAQFKGLFTGSNWFKSYKEVCDVEGKKAGLPVSVKSLETYISFVHKGILTYFAANDPAGLRGSTRFGSAIDELSWFGNKEGGVRANGPETISALDRSCLTVRGAVFDEIKRDPNCRWPMPILYNVSSPVAMDDPLMVLYRETAKNPRSIRKHWATWEAHPKHTRAYFEETGEAFKRNFERDYGAQPPIAHNPLFEKTSSVTDAFKTILSIDQTYGKIIRPSALGYVSEAEVQMGMKSSVMLTAGLQDPSVLPPVEVITDEETLESMGPMKSLYEELASRPASQRMHIMGIDLGHSDNGLGVVCGFPTDTGHFITDFVLGIKPSDRKRINIADVHEHLISPLVDHLNVVAVFYDRWSSLHGIHDLAGKFGSLGPMNDKASRRSWLRKLAKKGERPAFIADQYSLNMADAIMLVSRMDQGDLLFPQMEIGFMDLMVNDSLDPVEYPYTNLAIQMATVRKTSNRLLKPLNRDDDIFRAWANAVVPALTNELVIDLLSQEDRAQPLRRNNGKTVSVHLGQRGKGVRVMENSVDGAHSIGNNKGSSFRPIVKRGSKRGI